MKMRDPNKVQSRGGVVLPGSGNVESAVMDAQREQALRQNPLFKMMEDMRKDMAQLAAQSRDNATRFHALLDMMAACGTVLTQDLDEDGFGIPGTVRSPDDSPMLFEALKDMKLIAEMPEYGYEAYFVEHSKMLGLTMNVQRGLMTGALTAEQGIQLVRDFNAEEGRIHKVTGLQFGLDGYLNTNPDNLTDEQIKELAEEFNMPYDEVPDEETKAPAKEDDNVVDIQGS